MTTNMQTDMLGQAADTYFSAIKAGLKLQEDTAKRYADVVKNTAFSDDWVKQCQKVMDESIPVARKTTEDTFEAMEKSSAQCLDLLSKSVAASQVNSLDEAQTKFKQLWEDSLTAFRENVQSMIKLNSDALKAYTDFIKKHTDGAAATKAKAQAAK